MARQRAVFVSCGQRTPDEVELGRTLARTIEDNGLRPFFAQDVHSAGDLNSEVFKAIQTCDAFLGILQKRGVVTYAGFPPVERSSVWIQQEIPVFCYRMFLEQRSLPIRVFSERGILREGVIQIAIVNPIEFDRSTDVVSGVDAWLKSRDVAAGEHYPILIPDQAAMRSTAHEVIGDCSRARRVARSQVSLPVHPYLKEEEIGQVIDACNQWGG